MSQHEAWDIAKPQHQAASPHPYAGRGLSRRGLLAGSGLLGMGALAGPLLPASASARPSGSAGTAIQHVIVSCQENRSFDHYFGFAPFVGPYGVPAAYSQPDGSGGSVVPFEFDSLSTADVPHGWDAMHAEYHGGAMDGFYTTAGIDGMGAQARPDRISCDRGGSRLRTDARAEVGFG